MNHPQRSRGMSSRAVRQIQLVLSLALFVSFSWWLTALAGFWPSLLVSALVAVGVGAAVEVLVRRVAREADSGSASTGLAPGSVGRGLLALVVLETLLLVIPTAALLAPYSPPDLLRRALGYQDALVLEGAITSLSYAADGQRLLIGDAAGGLTLWSPSQPGGVRRLASGAKPIRQALFSPDGQLVALQPSDGPIELRHSSDGQLLRSLTALGTGLSFSADSTLLATGSLSGPAQVWRVADGQLLQTHPAQQGITFAGFAPDNTLISHLAPYVVDESAPAAFAPARRLGALGDPEGGLHLVEAVSGLTLRTISAHHDTVRALAFSPDGTLVASSGGSWDRSVRVWRVGDGGRAALYLPRSSADALAFAPDGRTLAVGEGREIALWRLPERP